MSIEIDEFCEKFDLDADSKNLLLDQSESLQDLILSQFAPKDTSRDCNNVFKKFVQSRMREEVGNDEENRTLTPEQRNFFDEFQLDEISQSTFLSSSRALQNIVLKDFEPKDRNRDMNANFMAFVRSRQVKLDETRKTRGHPGARLESRSRPDIKNFCKKFRLDTENFNELKKIPYEVQEEIIESFDPKDTSRDMNNLFAKFIKPHLVRGNDAERRPETRGSSLVTKTSTRTVVPRAAPCVPVSKEKVYLKKLLVRFPLNRDAEDVFKELPDYAQRRVQIEFAPRDTSRDCSAVFIKFCRDVHVRSFCEKWNLDDNSVELFNNLTFVEQQMTMEEFEPKDKARDCNMKFQSFVKSKIEGNGRPAKRERPETRERMEREERRPRKRPRQADEFQDFVDKYRLNRRSISIFESLSRTVQNIVLAKFKPRDTKTDCNAVFIKFAKAEEHRN